jgi:hypothetical protein
MTLQNLQAFTLLCSKKTKGHSPKAVDALIFVL